MDTDTITITLSREDVNFLRRFTDACLAEYLSIHDIGDEIDAHEDCLKRIFEAADNALKEEST